jgi:hypothetical protein
LSVVTCCAIAILWIALIVWELGSGVALGGLRTPRCARADRPFAYWFVLGVQCVILVVFLVDGRSWQVR